MRDNKSMSMFPSSSDVSGFIFTLFFGFYLVLKPIYYIGRPYLCFWLPPEYFLFGKEEKIAPSFNRLWTTE